MKWIKNIVFFLLLAMAFVFGSAEAKASTHTFKKIDKNHSIENIDYLKATAFVKPQSSTQIASDTHDHLTFNAKWFAAYSEIRLSYFSILKEAVSFLLQDINRCLCVSVLLFPFHIFW